MSNFMLKFKKLTLIEGTEMTKDLFLTKSKHWDMNSKRVQGAKAIADKIMEHVSLKKTMHLMDFGAGTGLLSYCLSEQIRKVTAIDNSPSMLEVFKEKSDDFRCETEVLELDFSHETLDTKSRFDGIISSMTIHHLEDSEAMLQKMYNLLPQNGFIALADLDTEKGDFHSDNAGVFHFGFERESLQHIAQKVGFREVKFYEANTINKPHATYTVFLMVGYK
jgi:cyclopropane fatty-acyl-phospholipid synthase-like methyltransferase